MKKPSIVLEANWIKVAAKIIKTKTEIKIQS